MRRLVSVPPCVDVDFVMEGKIGRSLGRLRADICLGGRAMSIDFVCHVFVTHITLHFYSANAKIKDDNVYCSSL